MTSPAGTMRPSLDAALARFVITPTDKLGPIAHAPVTHLTPAFAATCAAVPEARGCGHCGALLDAPCVTCSGKVTAPHKGRGCAA